ncbi:hypothetical protein QWJ90_14000, partial [Microbacterium oryzae]|nr:hypothetical protein [Microbacterium oryzae]
IACGPDLDVLAESVRPFVDAGFTDVAIVQVGDEQQERFLAEVGGGRGGGGGAAPAAPDREG